MILSRSFIIVVTIIFFTIKHYNNMNNIITTKVRDLMAERYVNVYNFTTI